MALSDLTIIYLFLGGAGSGALSILIVLSLLTPRASCASGAPRASRVSQDSQDSQNLQDSQASRGSRALRAPRPGSLARYTPQAAFRPLFFSGYLTGGGVLLLGVLCLLFDLGRPDRLLFLFLRPAPGYLVLGTYALVILIACTIVLCLIWGDPFARFPRWAVRAAEALGLLTAFAAMLYTGLLFQSIGTGTLLEMLLIPVIFVLSSLSTGIALLLLTTALTRVGRLFSTTLARLVRADVVLILLEGVGLALLLAFGLNGQQTQTATAELISGDFALVFWVGVVGCGLIAPLGFEGVSLRSDASGAPGARGVRGMSTRGMSSARATRAVSTGGMSSARATSGTSGRVIGMTPRREYTFVPVSLLLLIGGYCLRVALLGAGLPLFMAAAMTTTTLGALAV